MVKKNSGLIGELSYVERVLHQQEYVHVSGLPLGGDKRPEYHEPSHLARADGDTIDSFKPLRHRDPLPGPLPEAAKRLP